MTYVRSRRGTLGIVAAAAVLAIAATVVLASMAAAHQSTAAGAGRGSSTPPSSVSGSLIAKVPAALQPGHVVGQSTLGQRIFADARHGFALADVGGAQYPAKTVNGVVWRIAGPPLHLDAAQAPLVVTQVGARGKRTFFAWGGAAGGPSVDVTTDGGAHWYRALLGDVVCAVTPTSGGHLMAFAQVAGSGSSATTWVYVSKDGGRTWKLSSSLGGD
jgi:hypothetical protein